MEIERLKALKEEEAREVRKHEARKKGAQVIVDQIQERTVQRMKEQEKMCKPLITKTSVMWKTFITFQILIHKKCYKF